MKMVVGGLLAGVGAIGIIWGMIIRDLWKQEERVRELWREVYL